MKIEIAEPGRMAQTGSSLLKLIQNNDMPVLDLLVRESVQNSLDARKDNAKYVNVEYQTGSFRSVSLANELEGITDALNSRFGYDTAEFLAVKDSNTVGLTGEMDYQKVKDNQYGNLLKLIYEVCKPQEAAGAGGSWGLGKTVYFRIGIGIVIYYSRIKNGEGEYQSRLAASLVEKENSADAMIPVYNDQAKRGIAWWGELIGENITQPVTDEAYIYRFLDIFGIDPYKDDETGTTIIIPYIDSQKLLKNNQIEYQTSSGQTINPYWCSSLEQYISIAAQRWYAPRLANSSYTHGAYLRLMINGNGIAADDMEPVFKVIRSLYNRAFHVDAEDVLSDAECNVKVEPVIVNKYLNNNQIGTVAYTKINKAVLGMCAPYNKPEPYMYLNCEIRDTEVNKPVVCFTRKPGMIVSYENMGPWTSGISPSKKDEYIFGIFVLDSWNTLKNAPETGSVEEYVRRSEMADHTSWSDWSEGNYNPRLITKIQNKVSGKISQEFKPEEEEIPVRKNSGLSKMFGDMLLPPEGFGKGAGGGKHPPAGGSSAKCGISFEIDKKSIRYQTGEMQFSIILKSTAKKKLSSASFKILVDSEAKKIDVSEWETKMGLSAPFSINSMLLNVKKYDGVPVSDSLTLSADDSVDYNDISFRSRITKEGTCTGLSLAAGKPVSVELTIDVSVSVYRNDVKPAFTFEKGV